MRDDERITFVPDDGGESVEFSPSSLYFWKEADGMGGLKTDYFTSQGWRDGIKITGKRNPERVITITGQIRDDLGAYDVLRESLLRALRPKLCGKLVYVNALYTRHIPCCIQTTPEPSRGIYPEFDVEFLCPSPYWRGGDGTTSLVKSIAQWVGALVFPFVFTASGNMYGYRSPSLVTNFVNTGDEDLPLIIDFVVNSDASDPKITNIQTQEFLLVDGDFLAGDVIRINTDDDAMTAILIRGGVETNVFNQVTEDSTWLKLYVGSNYLRASASTDAYVDVTLHTDNMMYDGV